MRSGLTNIIFGKFPRRSLSSAAVSTYYNKMRLCSPINCGHNLISKFGVGSKPGRLPDTKPTLAFAPVWLVFVCSNVARRGTKPTPLIGRQQMTAAIGAATRVACIYRRTSRK